MAIVSTTTLANGSRVELSVGEIPRNGAYDLVAQLYDAKGVVIRTITVDTATNSDGSTAPPRGENFSHFSVVGLSGGGFAIAYDNTSMNAPGGSNTVEVHLYDVVGQATGVHSLGTSNGGQLSPNQGDPVLTATSSNGVILAARLDFGARTVVSVLEANGAVAGAKTYDGQPAEIYEAGFTGQVVVALTKGPGGAPLAEPVREVLTHTMSPISTTPLVQTTGTDAGEVLTGSANADILSGLSGNDTLQGGASFDSLTGGDGRDRFVFAVDGSVDRVTDFTAGQDTLALVDAGGAPLNASGGVLTFWRGSGVLTYDPDGDLGPAAAQTVAVLPGLKTLTAASFAPGYEPALVRIYNPITPAQAGLSPGSRSDLTFGFGKASYVSASADYSPTGTLLTYGVGFTDGTSSMQWFDTPNAQTWKNLVASYDTQGRLTLYATYDDDGSHILWRYDVDQSQTWQRIIDHYDAQGRYTARDVVNDDGTRFEAIYDVAGTQPWGYSVEHFTAAGASVGRSFFNDDGTAYH